MTDGYLSKNKAHLAKLQRQRRSGLCRIDYMPGLQALRVFQARQEQEQPGSAGATNSAVLDAILTEWAELTGIKYKEMELSRPSPAGQEFPRALALALGNAASPPGLRPAQRACARAYDFGTVDSPLITSKQRCVEARCGATRHRDGQPCQARPEPSKRRCRFHGGRSTGPRTDAGKARAEANLRLPKNLT